MGQLAGANPDRVHAPFAGRTGAKSSAEVHRYIQYVQYSTQHVGKDMHAPQGLGRNLCRMASSPVPRMHWSLRGSQRAGIGAEVRGIPSYPAAGQKRCSSCFASITRILSTGRLCLFPRYGGASRRLHYRRGGPDEMTAPAVTTMRRTTIARLTYEVD
jgi:hypothetical protein